MRDSKGLTIRNAVPSDAKVLTALAGELGYSTTVSEMKNRLNFFSSSLADKIFVAELDFVIGWIHIAEIKSVQSASFAEVRGIVVSKAHRNTGIGTRLIGAAENWAKEQCFNKIRVRTNINREQTLEFYQKHGYKSTKTQKVYDKLFQPSG